MQYLFQSWGGSVRLLTIVPGVTIINNLYLIVPPFTTLTITSDAPTGREFEEDQVTFPPGTGITVQFAGTLILDNARLTSCGEGEWAGITIEEGGRLRTDFPQIRNATRAIELQGNVNEANMNTNFISDCTIGMNLVGVTNITLTDPTGLGEYNRCNVAVHASKSNGVLDNVGKITQCRTGIRLVTSCEMDVINNTMNCSEVGISVNSSTARLGHNYINTEPQIVDAAGNVVVAEAVRDGIVTDMSEVIIDDNTINCTRQGVVATFPKGASIISDNVITLNGDNGFGTNGIYSWVSNGLEIENNDILGSGHNASIFALNCDGAEIVDNTVSSAGTDNGIAVTSGEGNVIRRNDIQQEPTNAIGIWDSGANGVHDNDITATNVGLLVGASISENQQITCNRFCEGAVDVRIGSVIGVQDHNLNQFRTMNSSARAVGLDGGQIADSRFLFNEESLDDIVTLDCTPILEAVDDPDDLFRFQNGTSFESCDQRSGSNLRGKTEEEFCELFSEQDNADWWLWYARLRQLLGRYFATHGPRQLPHCVEDCLPVELISMEAELRAAMGNSTEEGLENEGQDNASSGFSDNSGGERLKQVAEQQYQQLGGHGIVAIPDLEPCMGEGDELLDEPLAEYAATYKLLVQHVAYQNLDEMDLAQLQVIASQCLTEKGEVVSWARGLLSNYGIYEYPLETCDATDQRERTEKKEEGISLKAFPMPADDQFRVHFTTVPDGELILIDVAGRTVLNKVVKGSKDIQLSVGQLETGYYLLQYVKDDFIILTESITIQH